MLRILRFLWTGDWHLHKWRPTSQGRYRYESGGSGHIVYAVCETCGKRRSFEDATIGNWEKEPTPQPPEDM